VVEIEKIDDPHEDFSDGSSSNPSLDNFDMKEIYERIYEINDAEEKERIKQSANMRFFSEIQDSEYIDQQGMLQIIDLTFSSKNKQSNRNSSTKSRIQNVR
jgi:hypothetical protein